MKSKFFLYAIIVLLITCTGMLWAGGGQEEEPTTAGKIKVALLLDGAVTDGGWSQYPYEGLMRAGEDFDIEVRYTDMIQSNEIPMVMRDYANKGFGIIIGNGYTFLDAFASISPDYPDTMFVGLNIPNAGPNWMSARFEFGQAGHILALAMAAKTKTNKVAWISAFEAPHDNVERMALIKHLKKLNPKIELFTAYTGDWNDITKAKQTVLAVVDQGVDIVNCTLPAEVALAEAARERGDFYITGYPGESMDAGSDVILFSMIQDTSVIVYETIKSCINDEYQPGKAFHFGMAEGAVRVGKMNEDLLFKKTINSINKEVEGILNGSVIIDTHVEGWD